jgi:hypothetical protein
MMSPRGLAREKARLERTKDFTDRLDWAMFKPETSTILTFKSDGKVKIKRALMFCYNLNVSSLTSNLKQKTLNDFINSHNIVFKLVKISSSILEQAFFSVP